MEEVNRITNKELGEALIIGLLLIILCVMAIQLRNTQDRLTELERGTSEKASSQQAQIDELSKTVETVRSDMEAGFSDQQEQLDQHREQITSQKSIQSNTIKAFVRYQKQQADQNEEFKEELKND